MSNENKPLLTRKQVAAHFVVDPTTVKRWERKGLITSCCVINGRPRYKLEDFINESPISKPATNGK